MRDELRIRLRDEFPLFYEACRFEVEDGWFELLRRLGAAATVAIRKSAPGSRQGMQAAVAKQKYARLHVYTRKLTADFPSLDRAIEKHADESVDTCEGCGKRRADTVVRGGWETVLCAACEVMSQ